MYVHFSLYLLASLFGFVSSGCLKYLPQLKFNSGHRGAITLIDTSNKKKMDQLIKEETGNVMDSMEIGDSHLAKQIAKRKIHSKQQEVSNLIDDSKFGEHEFNGLSEKFQKYCDRSGNINKKGFRHVMTEFIHDQKVCKLSLWCLVHYSTILG